MNIDSLVDYLIPLGLLLLYIVSSLRKKSKTTPSAPPRSSCDNKTVAPLPPQLASDPGPSPSPVSVLRIEPPVARECGGEKGPSRAYLLLKEKRGLARCMLARELLTRPFE